MRALTFFLLLVTTVGAVAEPVPVEVVKTADGYRLMRGGEEYFVRGAGGEEPLELLAKLGGNSIRTWGHDQLEPRTWPDGRHESILDRAHRHGLTVCAGFWLGHPRHGFDYGDEAAVEAQLDLLREIVRAYKDHPALLMWAVGNEVGIAAHARDINEAARIVKEIDPHHPTMTAIAGVWPELSKHVRAHCPDIDILGINVYGGVNAIPQELMRQGYDGPYMITEFGPLGHWETAVTSWGAPVEQSSSGKARMYHTSYENGVQNQRDRCVGSYAFLWGQKQERTATWYGMFLDTGEKLASVDTMSFLWTGRWPDNRAPDVVQFESDAAMKRVKPGSAQCARATVVDADDDALVWRWAVKAESTDHRHGGDSEYEPAVIEGMITSDPGPEITFNAPNEPGAYRLFMWAYDGRGGAATANLPFYVEN